MKVPDRKHIARCLRESGLPRRAAYRMAEEWLAHRDDVLAAEIAAGVDPTAAAVIADQQLGDIRDIQRLIGLLPETPIVLTARNAAVTTIRWGGASALGMLVTLLLFGGMQHAIGV